MPENNESFEKRRESVAAAALAGKPFPYFHEKIPGYFSLWELYMDKLDDFCKSIDEAEKKDAVMNAALQGAPMPSFVSVLHGSDYEDYKALYQLVREESYQPSLDPVEVNKLFPLPSWAPSPPLVPEPEYQLDKIIGRGAFGAVYQGHHNMLGSGIDGYNRGAKYAIKILDPTVDGKRCVAEGQAAAMVESDFIVKIHNHGKLTDGRYYLVMDLVKGETEDPSLRAYIKSSQEIPPEEKVLRFMKEISEGMGAAAEAGITHRDLKPTNILIDISREKSGRARICDFGLARIESNENPSPGETTRETEVTRTPGNSSDDANRVSTDRSQAYFAGTPQYSAPEQIKNSAMANEQSDIFSFGAMFYHVLTGKPPTGDLTTAGIIEIKGRPPKEIPVPREPRELNPELSGDICELIMRCLENEPADRPGSFKAVREDLRNIPLHGRHRELLRKASRALEEGQLDFAIIYFSKMIGGFDDSAKARYGRGIAFLRSKNYKRARDDFTKAIGLKSDYADAYHHLGITYKRMGDTEKSEANFKKAEELGYTEED